MTRILLFLVFLSLHALGQQKQSFSEADLLGDWVGVKTKENRYPIEGISFGANHVFECKLGFFKTIGNERRFLGTKGKYKFEKDSLMILTAGAKTSDKFKLLGLHQKHLKMSFQKSVFDFSRPVKDVPPLLKFDKIIVSTSASFNNEVPISNTLINANGSVIFEGIAETFKIGLFAGNITPANYLKMQADFSKSNINKLTTWYKGSWTDQQTISVTFIKNGKIYKTFADYGNAAPYLFKAAYVQVRYLYQNLPLKVLPIPSYLQNVDLRFRKSDEVLDIRGSELFMLQEALRNGKVVRKMFFQRFKIRSYKTDSDEFDDLYTDGRYFQFFKNGKKITVDIGFNFYDFNSQHWQWKKYHPIESMYH